MPLYLFVYAPRRIIYAFCEVTHILLHSFYKFCSFFCTKKSCKNTLSCIIILHKEKHFDLVFINHLFLIIYVAQFAA